MANPQSPVGSANRVVCFPITSSKSTITAALSFNKNVDESITGHPIKGSWSIALTSRKNNIAFNTFLNSYLRDIDIEPTEETYTDGTKDTISAISVSSPHFLVVHCGGLLESAYQLSYGVGVLTGDTGNRSFANKSMTDTPVEIRIVQSPAAYTFLGTSIYEYLSDIIATVADQSIAADAYGSVIYVSVKTA